MKKALKKKAPKKLTASQITKIFSLAKQGKSQRQIAKIVGCGVTTVWDRLNK